MEDMEFWTNFTALLPDGVETQFNEDRCTVSGFGKSANIVRNDNSFVINGKSLHFEDDSEDIINTLLVPYVLQELDGHKRIS